MKRILLIATGGTIASKPREGRLSPAITPAELLSYVPEIKELCEVETETFCSKDSTNMDYGDWLGLSREIEKNYPAFDGFVITHGTDTMAYCAAALSYFVQASPKPIVITGSQKSIYLRDTDARRNLFDAFLYAADSLSSGCRLVFDGEVILGTRAKKTRTKSYNAFSSMDYPAVAKIVDGKIIRFIPDEKGDGPVFSEKIDTSVAVIKLIPGQSPDVLEYLSGRCRAVVIESFGVGGIPYYESGKFEAAIKKLLDAGAFVIMTTQVMSEGSDLCVYQVGEASERLGLIEARDMTLEAIVGKCVWALGKEEDFKKLFLTPVGKDILYEANS
ncbi:MAG: asparaginase [Clostridia bacterium]|nr:asparaginase [Clostridia bacterium]